MINLMTWLYDRLMSYAFIVTPTTSVEGRHEIDGMFFHATGFVPRKHTTDTAGYSDIVFGTAALSGVFYVPIIRDFSSLVFSYLDIGDRHRFKNLGSLLRAKVSFDPIQHAWGKIMDYAATIDARRTRPSQMIAKMQLLGAASDLAAGVEAIGKIEKSIVGLSFAGFESLRRETLIMHNKQESHNALKAAILFGNKGAYHLSADQAIQNRHACLEIMASLLILHNAVHLDAAWKHLLRQGHDITSEHMRRIYPTGTSRINWLGDLIFADTRDLRIPIDRVRLLKP